MLQDTLSAPKVELCSICTNEMSENDISVAKCQHKFHTSCLCKWACSSKNATCPLCREQLFEEYVPPISTISERNDLHEEIARINQRTAQALEVNAQEFVDYLLESQGLSQGELTNSVTFYFDNMLQQDSMRHDRLVEHIANTLNINFQNINHIDEETAFRAAHPEMSEHEINRTAGMRKRERERREFERFRLEREHDLIEGGIFHRQVTHIPSISQRIRHFFGWY